MRQTHSSYRSATSALMLAIVGLPSSPTLAAEVHASKAVFADVQNWRVTAPGTVKLENFKPFRAVYDRRYTQGSGPGAGEKRQDRVIVSAERVGWDGTPAVAISAIDSAAPKYVDTNMRVLTMVASVEDLAVLFEIGPLPGKAKDYYIGLFTGQAALVSNIQTATQELQPMKIPTTKAGFGPGSWVMASMPLAAGLKINLAPYYSPQANPISQTSYGRVVERKTISDGSGTEHQSWVVETSGWYGLESPKVLQLFLKNAPPYYLGTDIYNYDTGERKHFVQLRDVLVTEP